MWSRGAIAASDFAFAPPVWHATKFVTVSNIIVLGLLFFVVMDFKKIKNPHLHDGNILLC